MMIAKQKNLKKKINQNKIIEEKINSKVALDIQNKNCVLDYENEDKNIIRVMKNLKICYIIKSFFCFRDKKLKLINLCNDIVSKDICVERILKRLYILENGYNSMKESTNKSFIDNDISKIKNIIKRISNETNKQIKNQYGNIYKK